MLALSKSEKGYNCYGNISLEEYANGGFEIIQSSLRMKIILTIPSFKIFLHIQDLKNLLFHQLQVYFINHLYFKSWIF